MNIRTEQELVSKMIPHVKRLFGRRAQIAFEVNAHGRSKTDVCVYAEGSLVAIEAKLVNWQRALGQALLNSYYADRSYIAVFETRLNDRLLEQASRHGIGVMAIGRRGLNLIDPTWDLSRPDPTTRSRVIAATFDK